MSESHEVVPQGNVPARVVRDAEAELALGVARRDPRAIKAVHDKAQALEKLIQSMEGKRKKVGDQLRKLNNIAKVRISAAREMGNLLAELVRRGGPPYRGRKLEELGVSRNQSSKFQRLAKLADMVEPYIEACNAREDEASIAGYIRYAKSDVHFSSNSDEWYTPDHIVKAVIEVLGAIDLDPCSNPGEPNIPAAAHYTEEDDGLTRTWRGKVYMNPPYGRQLPKWIQKLKREHDAGQVEAAIALLPARPGSDWFDELAEHPVCFLRGRLQFSEGNPAPFPSMFIYVGNDSARFIRVFRNLGCLYQPVKPDGAS